MSFAVRLMKESGLYGVLKTDLNDTLKTRHRYGGTEHNVGGAFAIDGREAIVEFGQCWVGFEFPHADRLGRFNRSSAGILWCRPMSTWTDWR